MGTFRLTLAILTLVAIVVEGQVINPFDVFYRVQWGGDHAVVSKDRTMIELLLNETSGGAGFESKQTFLSGYFNIRMKVPEIKSRAVIASFFMSSERKSESPRHDELDFEFFGTSDQPYLQTNVFAQDLGEREQSFHLWFDPTADFHAYGILWGVDIVVFFVDDVPIRVFKNHQMEGVNSPSMSMRVEASIWNATWAGTVDWAKGPFRAQYQPVAIFGCPTEYGQATCIDSKYIWNTFTLKPEQLEAYENVRKNNMFYDYCSDKPKKECELPNY